MQAPKSTGGWMSGEGNRTSPDPTPEPEPEDGAPSASASLESEPASPDDPLAAASDELPRSADEDVLNDDGLESESEFESDAPVASSPKRSERSREPHQFHSDLAFTRTSIYFRTYSSYDISRPGAVAAGEESHKLDADGMGFLLSAGWTWRFLGAGGELMHTWGDTVQVSSEALRQVGAGGRATPHFTSVSVYADLRALQRWFTIRAGVGLGGVALTDYADELELDDSFGLVPHLSARFSVPIDYGVRVFAGAGARVLIDGVWHGMGGSVLDWRLGVELN